MIAERGICSVDVEAIETKIQKNRVEFWNVYFLYLLSISTIHDETCHAEIGEHHLGV
jgi:hypothetical protein